MSFLFFHPYKDNDFYLDFLTELKSFGIDFKIIVFSKQNAQSEINNNFVVWPKLLQPKNNGLKFLVNPLCAILCFFKFFKLKNEYRHIIFFKPKDFKALLIPALLFKKVWLLSEPDNINKASFLESLFFRLAKKKINYLLVGEKNSLLAAQKYPLTESILPGIKTKGFLHQENIFSDLATHNSPKAKKKFFTIGTIADFNSQHNLEVLFHAAQSVKRHIPELQITIIGDSSTYKQLIWQCKKLKIDSFVWFVGKQKYLGKWLNGFDLYININENNNLDSVVHTMQAMAYGLPVIACANSRLDAYIKNLKNGILLDLVKSDNIINAVMKLEQNKPLRSDISKNNKDLIDKEFNIARMVNQFIELTN